MSTQYWPTLLTALILSVLVSAQEDSIKNKKIVIVGAGASGIAAAKTLLLNGYESIQILEAQDYYGGRIRPVFDEDNQILEFGAQRQENLMFSIQFIF